MRRDKPAQYIALKDKFGPEDELGDIQQQQQSRATQELKAEPEAETPQKRRSNKKEILFSPDPVLSSTPLRSPIWSPSTMSASTPSSSLPKKGGGPMFKNIEEAIEFCDEVVDLLDFHSPEEDCKPEENNFGLFVQKITKITSMDGKKMITKLKVSVPDIVNL